MYIFISGEGSSFLSFRKGDLIILEDESSGETVINSGWCVGRCERTGEKGDFPAETVYVLPSLTKPPNDILVTFLSCYFLQWLCNSDCGARYTSKDKQGNGGEAK